MAERIDLVREVFNKAEYIKTIDTSFNEFGATTITQDLEAQPSVQEFFGLYNTLFYDIPAIGDTNSHQYLARTSGEYINFEEVNGEIQALQAEIAQLRSDLLTAQIENARVLVSNTGDEEVDKTFKILTKELQVASENIITTNTTLSDNTQTSTNSSSPASGGVSSGGVAGGNY